MRIACGLHLDDAGDGAVRVRALDWPWAGRLAAPPLLAGLALVGWSAATRHWIELGGGAVFVAAGCLCGWLAMARRRDLVVGAASVRGREGAGPFAREVDLAWTGDVRFHVRPFATPDGAPGLADRGGDLVLVAPGAEILLARRAGHGWRRTLEAARGRLVERIPAAPTAAGLDSPPQEDP